MFIGGNDICDFCTDSVSTLTFFHLALIFIVTIKPFDIQTDNLSNNKTCKSQYFSSWCCFFFCTFSEKKKQTFSFFTDLFLAQEHSRSYPGSPGHPPQRGAFSLLCSVVKPHRHSHKHTPRHGVNVLFSVIQVPRAIVNLVELMNIVPLRELHSNKTLGCPTWFVKWVYSLLQTDNEWCSLWKVLVFLHFSLVCPCVLKPKDGSVELQKVVDFNKAYQVKGSDEALN